MYPCPHCGYPAVYDVMGQTDHVCVTGPRAEEVQRWMDSMPSLVKRENRVIIESTAAGMSSFYEAYVRAASDA